MKSTNTLPRRSNLVVFLPDQQRPDTLAAYGGVKVHSPNLAKLASQSVVFDRAYVTQPVCTPSRSSLMTGLWPHTNGCTRNLVPLDPKFPIFPQLLNDGDYRTGYMGKWHLGPDGPHRGFQEYISTRKVSDYSEFLVSQGLKPDTNDGRFSELAVSKLPIEFSQPKFLERHACEFIEKNRNKPFILVVAFVEPHSPYNGPLNDEHALDEIDLAPTTNIPLHEEVPLRYRLMREWQEEQVRQDPTGEVRQFYFGITPEDYRNLKQKYLGLVTLVDRSIGAILDCLERHGLSEHTAVVHTSDHGDMLGGHQLFGKEVMFEEAVRVPWLAKLPGQQRGRRVSQAVSHIDFVPTLLDLLGQPKAAGCTGKSLVPLFRGEDIPPENVFIEWSPNRTKVSKGSSLAPRRMINRVVEESTRTVIAPDGWKLSLRDKDLNELYNLNDDPLEAQNLYSNEQYRDVISRLTSEIHWWQERTHDRLKL